MVWKRVPMVWTVWRGQVKFKVQNAVITKEVRDALSLNDVSVRIAMGGWEVESNAAVIVVKFSYEENFSVLQFGDAVILAQSGVWSYLGTKEEYDKSLTS